MATPIFLDTSVFLYAAGAEHEEKEPCGALLRRIAEGAVSATTSVEVVQELVYVLGRRGRIGDGIRLARNVLALFPALLSVTRDDMLLACRLLEKVPGLPPRDAVHAATMRNNGLIAIVSSDRHFDAVSDLRRLAAGRVG